MSRSPPMVNGLHPGLKLDKCYYGVFEMGRSKGFFEPAGKATICNSHPTTGTYFIGAKRGLLRSICIQARNCRLSLLAILTLPLLLLVEKSLRSVMERGR